MKVLPMGVVIGRNGKRPSATLRHAQPLGGGLLPQRETQVQMELAASETSPDSTNSTAPYFS